MSSSQNRSQVANLVLFKWVSYVKKGISQSDMQSVSLNCVFRDYLKHFHMIPHNTCKRDVTPLD